MDDKNEFIRRNLLESYLDKNNEFKHKDTENPYCWWCENIDEKDYRDFAIDYIAKATNIINCRAEKITEILQTIYK